MNQFLYEVTASVAKGWSNSLWALFFVVAGGAICFIIWAPGKRSESKSSSKEKQFVSGLLYREVTTYVEIEGGKRRDRIRVTQKRFSEE